MIKQKDAKNAKISKLQIQIQLNVLYHAQLVRQWMVIPLNVLNKFQIVQIMQMGMKLNA